MRILMMIHRLWKGGGTETHVLTLALGLMKRGHHVTLYTSGGPWVSHARSLRIPVRVDPALYHSRNRVERVQQFARGREIDVIHAHDAPTMQVAALVRRRLRNRPGLVFTVHGRYVVHRIPFGLIRGTPTSIVAVSPSLRQQILHRFGLPNHRVITISNGIETDVFRPTTGHTLRRRLGIPKEAFVIGYAGRFTAAKSEIGRRIVQTLRQFSSQRQNVYILVAGRGSRRVLNPTARVRLLGHVSNMQMFYNACDLVIGTGRVAAESISCAVPTLAIGTVGYYGLVRRKNFRQMVQSNFGDHGMVRPWNKKRLLSDVRQVLQQKAMFHRESKHLRQTLKRQLGARRMVSRILATYQRN